MKTQSHIQSFKQNKSIKTRDELVPVDQLHNKLQILKTII